MKRKNWSVYLFRIILLELTAACGWWIIRGGVESYLNAAVRPSLMLPPGVFLTTWGILHGLMGVSLARIRMQQKSPEGDRGTNWFIVQLILNFFWGQVFFGSQSFGFALLWALIMLAALVLMLRDFFKADRFAAWLQIPYLLWSIFSAYLNWNVWLLNRQ